MRKKKLLIKRNIGKHDKIPDEREQFEAICDHLNDDHRYLKHFVHIEDTLDSYNNQDNHEGFDFWLTLFYETK